MDFAFFKSLIINRLRNDFLFGDVLQSFNDEVPERLDALDEQGFVRRVWVHQRGAEAHHIPVRVL